MPQNIDKILSYNPGDIIIHEGEEAQAAYLVRSGHVQIFIKEPNGQRKKVAQLGPGQIFGEMALIRNYRHSASAEAADKVTLVPISKALMDKKLEKTDPLIQTILTALIERLYKETFLGN